MHHRTVIAAAAKVKNEIDAGRGILTSLIMQEIVAAYFWFTDQSMVRKRF